MPLVYDRPQQVADWVASQCGVEAPTVDAAIGFETGGELVAGVYFDAPTPNNAFAHIASTAGVLPRALLCAVVTYVYVQLGMERMTFLVSSENKRVLDFVMAMGARMEGGMRRAFGPAADGLWFVLWRDDPFAQNLLQLQRTRFEDTR